MPADLPILGFESPAEWEAWLAANHATAPGVRLRLVKKGVPEASVSYAQAVEVALCYGWIDGQAKSLGPTHWTQRFTPRRPRSLWSRINCDKVEALIASGRMQLAGLREVERAKADGRWESAYASPSVIEVPAELAAALEANPAARAFFATLNSRNRYAILHRITTAKRPETRSKRTAEFVAMLAEGKLIHP